MKTQIHEQTNEATEKIDKGLACLVLAARTLGIPAEYRQLRRAYAVADGPVDRMNLLRAAKQIQLKAKFIHTTSEKLTKLPLPAIAVLKDASYALLMKANADKILLFDPEKDRPALMNADEFYRVWNGELMFLARKFSLAALGREFNLKWFVPVVVKYKRLFCEVLAASFFLQLFGLITPLFSQVIIDKVLVHKGVSTLDILAAGLFLIALFEGAMGILRSWLFSHTTNRVDVILGAKLFDHLLALPIKYFEVRRVGDTVARVRELDNIRQFITGSALTVVMDLFFCSVFVLVMFFYSAKLSFVALAAVPFFVGLSVIVTPIFRERLNHKFACGAESQSYLVESITGIHTLKSLAIEPQMNRKWEGILANYVKASFNTTILSNIAGNVGQCIHKISSLAILWFGAHLVMDGEITVGELIAFQMLSGRVIEPVLRLVNTWQDFQQVRLSVERLGDVLNSPREPAFNPNRTTLPTIKGQILFEDISFRYRVDGPVVLDHISLQIAPGSTIGIVGRSGSGKSTLTKLAQRLYVPERGRVLIDGIDLTQVEPAWLRRQIGVVLQENFLFNGSVRDNIATAEPGASMQKIVWAAQLAGAHEFIVELPEGYDTSVGERGASLSGGQRQRIAIARALLTNPRILIFDEATSALDYQSERIIQQNLEQICKGRTVLIIAHRLSTVRRAGTIVVMEKGRIAEAGSHSELIERRGIYYRLHSQQEGGEACVS